MALFFFKNLLVSTTNKISAQLRNMLKDLQYCKLNLQCRRGRNLLGIFVVGVVAGNVAVAAVDVGVPLQNSILYNFSPIMLARLNCYGVMKNKRIIFST